MPGPTGFDSSFEPQGQTGMYLARFSYDFVPTDREPALACLEKEVEAASAQGLNARLLVPLTRPPGGAALQLEVEMDSLNQFETLRHEGGDASQGKGSWFRELTQLLTHPPEVQIFRIAATELTAAAGRSLKSLEQPNEAPPDGLPVKAGQTTEFAATHSAGALTDANHSPTKTGTG